MFLGLFVFAFWFSRACYMYPASYVAICVVTFPLVDLPLEDIDLVFLVTTDYYLGKCDIIRGREKSRAYYPLR